MRQPGGPRKRGWSCLAGRARRQCGPRRPPGPGAAQAGRPPVPARTRLALSFRFLRRLLVGAVLVYTAVALTLGGTPQAPLVFRLLALLWLVAVAAWYRRALR